MSVCNELVPKFESSDWTQTSRGCPHREGPFPGTGGPAEEAKQALINTDEILKAAGCDFTNVVKTTVLLAAMNDFSAVKIYKQLFKSSFPTTAAHQVVALPKGGHVETHAGAVQGSLTTASL
ncbi:unnamed protein product [Nyctereutes procyonoides]|uniref:(raccoon dog) hypothetical protein n=1 Tax=Nyctereutes procyonoides TaxID=34880 RepID=A0A811YYA5_NYCPR|nr:unnamed protein product [Nyctereutes procyonoides]